jgi:hypothetical protein
MKSKPRLKMNKIGLLLLIVIIEMIAAIPLIFIAQKEPLVVLIGAGVPIVVLGIGMYLEIRQLRKNKYKFY